MHEHLMNNSRIFRKEMLYFRKNYTQQS